MKKNLFILCTLFLSFNVSSYAQVLISNNSTTVTTSNQNQNIQYVVSNNDNNPKAGIGFEYLFIEDGWGWGINWLPLDNWFLNYSMNYGDTNDYIKSNNALKLATGYNGRYWFNDHIYLDGAIGIEWWYSSIDCDGADNDSSSSELALMFAPKIGLNLGSNICVNIGYRWDFNKFKFDSDYIHDYCTVGLMFAF